MASKVLDLLIKVTDQASKKLEDIKGSTDGGGVAGMAGELEKAAAMAGAAYLALKPIVDLGIAAYKGWQDWGLEVDNLASSIGSTTEEASVLVQLMADWDISNSAMIATLQRMAVNGIDPTVQGFAEVRAQLDEAGSAADRMALAMELLGQQGVRDILPMLDQLTDVQLANYINGMDEAKILTEEEAVVVRENEVATEQMGDAWENFAMQFGGWIAPGVTQALNNITGSAGYMSDEVIRALEQTGQTMGEFQRNAAYLEITVEQLANKVTNSGSRWTAYAAHLKEAEDQARRTSRALAELSAEVLPEMAQMGYDPYEGNIPGVTTAGPGKAKATRRYYGGGGGGGIGNEDLEELFEDLIEVLEDLPKAIRDAVNRVD